MKLKRRIGIGVAVAAVTYCVLAYIFMWPPVVLYYWNWHEHNSRGEIIFSPPRPLWNWETWRGRGPEAVACQNNLRQIDSAINQFALEYNKHSGEKVTTENIKPYIKLDRNGQIPSCPAGGTYIYGIIGQEPACSLGTNPPIRIRADWFFWKWSSSILHRFPNAKNDLYYY